MGIFYPQAFFTLRFFTDIIPAFIKAFLGAGSSSLKFSELHAERVLVAVQNIDHLFRRTSQIIKAEKLSDGTRIDDNQNLESLENGTELIVCTEEQIQKFSVYFELKRYLSLKKIDYPLSIHYFN